MELHIALIAIFVIGPFLCMISDECTKRKIRRFNKKLVDLEKRVYRNEIIPDYALIAIDETKEGFEYGVLALAPRRLRNLELCTQCPLYLKISQADTRGKPQEPHI